MYLPEIHILIGLVFHKVIQILLLSPYDTDKTPYAISDTFLTRARRSSSRDKIRSAYNKALTNAQAMAIGVLSANSTPLESSDMATEVRTATGLKDNEVVSSIVSNLFETTVPRSKYAMATQILEAARNLPAFSVFSDEIGEALNRYLGLGSSVKDISNKLLSVDFVDNLLDLDDDEDEEQTEEVSEEE
jgi:hypothetical protein